MDHLGRSRPIEAAAVYRREDTPASAQAATRSLVTRVYLVRLLCAVAAVTAISTSSASADSCSNATFRQGPSANLPDCRAYEMVSPPFKNGQFVVPAEVFLDESNILGSSLGAFDGAGQNQGVAGAEYVLGRGTSGWSATSIDLPATQTQGRRQIAGPTFGPVMDISHDFTKALLADTPVSAKQIDTRFYIRQSDGSLVEVGPILPPAKVASFSSEEGDPTPNELYQGASADLSHFLFSIVGISSPNPAANFLWPGDTTVQVRNSLYEYVGTGHTGNGTDIPALVGVDNSGVLISQCGTELGGVLPGEPQGNSSTDRYHAISKDGSEVFFTAISPGATCAGAGPPVNEVFARLNSSQTVAISEPTAADCSACEIEPAAQRDAIFQGASEDGSKAFFLTSQPLLGGDSTQNLYAYDSGAPTGQKVTRISAGDPAGANVQGVARISQDGSHVYFVAEGVLTAAPNSQGQVANPAAHNLYLYERDSQFPAGRTVFIAALSGSDSEVWHSRSFETTGAIATPDGRYLLLTSQNHLTADTSGTGPQLYRYDAVTKELERVSVGEQGFNQNGNTISLVSFRDATYGSLAGPGAVSMSDDGAYVFFQTPTRLTPQALNEANVGCAFEEEGVCYEFVLGENVYEWHDGHVYLLSDGQDRHFLRGNSTTNLIGASHSGSDVFVETADQLTRADTDTQQDIYDARIDGGFRPPVTPSSCQGETCQGPLSGTPLGQTPGSSTFSGPGNPLPPTSKSTVKPKPKPLTSAQKLAKALKACRTKHDKHKRATCERQARKRYRPTSLTKHKAKHAANKGGK
jgi:hypothetical protein